MSLINEALKKAQKPRPSDDTGAGTSGEVPGYLRRPAGAPAFNIVRWSVATVLFSCAIGAAVGFLLTVTGRDDPEPADGPLPEVQISYHPPVPGAATIQPAPEPRGNPVEGGGITEPRQLAMATREPVIRFPGSSPETEKPDPEPTPAPSPPAEPTTPPTTQNIDTAPAGLPPEPIREPETESEPTPETDTEPAPEPAPAPFRPIPEQPVQVADTPEPATPSGDHARADANPAIIEFLENSRITGVKVAGKHSRILMNNRVYRMDSVIDTETGLRITEIKNNEIQLIDESGIRYRKTF